MYRYEIQTCMFTGRTYGLGMPVGIKEDTHLTFRHSAVWYLGKKAPAHPLRGLHGKSQGKSQVSIKT